jgi:hypothetical protein
MAYRMVKYQGDPKDPEAIMKWAENELQKLEVAFTDLDLIRLVEQDAAPSRPRAGDIRQADGTHWNPGSGQGIYGYYGGAWHKF